MSDQPKKKPSDFKFGKLIGEGSFSQVFLTKEISSGKEYAMKVLEKRHIIKEKKTEYVKREKDVLLRIDHPFFVKLHFTFQDEDRLYFGLSYAPCGELLDYIKKNGCFDEQCTRFYVGEIIEALEYLHGIHIIHRDLKPENILLSDEMHILITDFGSAKIVEDRPTPLLPDSMKQNGAHKGPAAVASIGAAAVANSTTVTAVAAASGTASAASGTAATTAAGGAKAKAATISAAGGSGKSYGSGRRNSFVGTAQYVSPEILKSSESFYSSDLWALGCIIYQLLSGHHPFWGSHEYQIFQKILKLEYEFPKGFNSSAEDLVRRLLVLDPRQRLGCEEMGGYPPLKSHAFLTGLPWGSLHTTTPPKVLPYLPAIEKNSENMWSDLQAGLDDQKLSRLVEGVLLGTDCNSSSNASSGAAAAATAAVVEPRKPRNEWYTEDERRARLEVQERSNEYHRFVERNLILRQGLMDKRKGLFARRRMFLLTEGPRFFYVDPSSMTLKGEIPWSRDLRPEAKNFKILFVHTPNRVYYLEDPEGNALKWCKEINRVREHYYPTSDSVQNSSLTNSKHSLANNHNL